MHGYHATLMDHYRYPRNRGPLADATFTSAEHNPSCGDSVTLYGRIVDNRLSAVTFEGKGCVISQAAASMLTEAVMHKAVADILALDAAWMVGLVGVELGPIRSKCALLSLEALKNGLKNN